MADVFCNQCGHKNPLGANFCSSCGAPLEKDLDDIPPGAGLLVVTRGPNAGSRMSLTKPVTTIGRHPDSDIFLDDITVSRRHAELHRGPKGFVVRDVGSLNGTYLNRERVEENAVQNGDEVQVGKFKLLFFAGPA